MCLDGDTPGGAGRGRWWLGCCTCYCFRYDSPCAILLGLLGIGILGLMLGLIFPSSSSSTSNQDQSQHDDDTAKWDSISNILGYTYFLSWTLSFYPQIITNWKQPSKARHGLSLDFVVWNIVGFACYAIYTTSFLYSNVVRKEYAERFGGGDDSDDGGNNAGNVTASFVGTLFSGISGEMTANYDGTGYSNNNMEIMEIPNPFNWTWGGNSTTDDDSSSNSGNDDSNTTNTNDGSNHSEAIAVPQVKGNDVAFAWHALILTIITFVQIVWWSGRNKTDHATRASNSEGWIEVGGEDDVMVGDLGCVNDRLGGLSAGEEDDFVCSNLINNENSPDKRMESDYLVGDPQLENRSHLRQNLQQKQGQEQIIAHTHTALMPISQSDIHWTKRISSTTKWLILLLLLMCVAGAIMVACNVNITYWGGGDQWQWIDYLYFLSFVKVSVSIVKYIPQVVLNYRRKSTSGWQIWNILLDISGGTLSIVQLVGDSLAEAKAQGLPHSWTGIIGNPAKFGLGLASIFFDVSECGWVVLPFVIRWGSNQWQVMALSKSMLAWCWGPRGASCHIG